MKTKNITTLHLRNSIGRSLSWRRGLLLIPLVLVCFALPPKLQSACTDCFPPEHEAFYACIGFDGLSFHDITTFGCSALYNATFTECSDPITSDACGIKYSGPDMSGDTAFGSHALFRNTAGGNYNSALGAFSLYTNTTGDSNSAVGFKALYLNNSGVGNTALGAFSLYSNTTASQNTAVGDGALQHISTVGQSTAVGYQALANATGGRNEAFGASALFHNTGGIGNVAVGGSTLVGNTVGFYNVGLGENAGGHLTTGNGNVCIGYNVLGAAGESNTTRIRNVYSSLASARAVYVNSDSKIGTLASTRRVKENIRPMDKASEVILALQPVSFRYKKEIDVSGTPQFGLIAEEVAEIDADLITRDEEGKPQTVRYEAVNAMLLNEFLKEHRTVQELKSTATTQEATISRLKSTVAQQLKDFQATAAQQEKEIQALTASLKEQGSQIQKVSAQVEMSRRASQIVDNHQ